MKQKAGYYSDISLKTIITIESKWYKLFPYEVKDDHIFFLTFTNLSTDLVSALPSLDVYDFSHDDGVCFQSNEVKESDDCSKYYIRIYSSVCCHVA